MEEGKCGHIYLGFFVFSFPSVFSMSIKFELWCLKAYLIGLTHLSAKSRTMNVVIKFIF